MLNFKQYANLIKELEQLRESIVRLDARIKQAKIPFLTDDPRSTVPVTMQDSIVKLIELRERYEDLFKLYVQKQERLSKLIEQLDDPVERTVMRYRYVDGMTLQETAEKINYSYRQTKRIYKIAAKKMSPHVPS